VDLPRSFTIRESSHRIHNPFTSEKLAILGRALRLAPDTGMLDLACGTGEMLCTWARDHRVSGLGVDISSAFIAAARARADELDVADRVTFAHGDASGYVADEGCYGIGQDDWLPLPGLIESFGRIGCDVVELVLADPDSWDRYEAAKWLNIRRWLDANPHDELAGEMRAELDTAPARHVRYQREYLGWGVFVLMNR
jgi:SAM-dependent methyltransferase